MDPRYSEQNFSQVKTSPLQDLLLGIPSMRAKLVQARHVCGDRRARGAQTLLLELPAGQGAEARRGLRPVLHARRVLVPVCARKVALVNPTARLVEAVERSVREPREALAEEGAPNASRGAESNVHIPCGRLEIRGNIWTAAARLCGAEIVVDLARELQGPTSAEGG